MSNNLFFYLDKAQKNIFRYEGLQDYDIGEEQEGFQEFIRTGKIEIHDNKEWDDFIKKQIEKGVKMQRLRKVILPLSDYVRYELPFHQFSSKLGEKGFIIDNTLLDDDIDDFYLIDDKLILLMNYDVGGKYLGFKLIEDDIDRFLKFKERNMPKAQEIDNYIKANFNQETLY